MTQPTDQVENLWAAFQQLPTSQRGGQVDVFRALCLPDYDEVYLAKDAGGHPLFLIGTGETSSARAVRLHQLWVGHSIRARLEGIPGGEQIRRVSLIECRAETAELQRLFIECLSNALPPTRDARSATALNQLITHLVALFAAASSGSQRPVSGLWGELYVISRSAEPVRAIQAWHQLADEHFDFAEGADRVEVKSGRSHERRHHFSLEQANPPPDVFAYVISLVVDPVAHGLSVGDLRARCLAAVGADLELRAKVDRLCVEYLGVRWEEGMGRGFDEQVAAESLQVYDLRTIPRITAPPPAGVSDVTFVSSLELANPVTVADLSAGGLAQALLVGAPLSQ